MEALIDFDEVAANATDLINEVGRPLVLKRNTAPAEEEYDPVTGDTVVVGGSDPATFAVRAVVLSMTTGYAMRVGQQNVQLRDRLLLMGPAVQPVESDVVSFDGEDWQVVRVEETAPNGTPLCFICQVRP